MIWSVSTLLRRSGTAVPESTVIGYTSAPLLGVGQGRKVGGRGQSPAHRRRRGDERRDEVRPAALALTALEVAVRRGGAALAGRELVGVHPEAHRAARVPPVGAGLLEDDVETLRL